MCESQPQKAHLFSSRFLFESGWFEGGTNDGVQNFSRIFTLWITVMAAAKLRGLARMQMSLRSNWLFRVAPKKNKVYLGRKINKTCNCSRCPRPENAHLTFLIQSVSGFHLSQHRSPSPSLSKFQMWFFYSIRILAKDFLLSPPRSDSITPCKTLTTSDCAPLRR